MQHRSVVPSLLPGSQLRSWGCSLTSYTSSRRAQSHGPRHASARSSSSISSPGSTSPRASPSPTGHMTGEVLPSADGSHELGLLPVLQAQVLWVEGRHVAVAAVPIEQ
eukprot:7349150-Prymnesium_polylepis.1